MAQGDLTKEIVYDKIEVVNTWTIQVRQATKIMEEQADGKWTHTPTDLSGEDASVKAIAEAAWTDTVKANYKTFTESQTIL